ncbi:MAG: DUF4249 family protein [Bacteroidetes bacterium]|nr:DUF4249 family protein [Bacteroidota bacterium]MBL7066398.1 DUF4249 family protein [Candidatus Neomarinimicrobiota bacterium]
MVTKRIFYLFLVIITFSAAISLSKCGKWGWEDVTSDHEPVLNVFALISLDTTIQSFVRVHNTLGLEEPEKVFVRKDTIWYGEGPYDYWLRDLWESKYLVKDAVVIISDGNNDYTFSYINLDYDNWEYYDYYRGEESIYLDTLNKFHPQPNTTYFLDVSTPDGKQLTGEVTTPPIPVIYSKQIPDTVYIRKTFTVTWKPLETVHSLIQTSSILYWICGAEQRCVREPGDSSWTSSIVDCHYYENESSEPDSFMIELHTLDDNYYEYFIKHAWEDEFVSFLLGGGDAGLTIGVEGGYGVFGAIAADRVYRVVVP